MNRRSRATARRLCIIGALSALGTLLAAETSGAAGMMSPATRPTPRAAPALANSCDVISRSAAARALGQRVSVGIPSSTGNEGAAACAFFGPDSPIGATADDGPVNDSVWVTLNTTRRAFHWFVENQDLRVGLTEVSGLGTRAWYAEGALSVWSGGEYLIVSVSGVGDPRRADEQLVRDALPRM